MNRHEVDRMSEKGVVDYFDKDFDWNEYVRDIVPTMVHLLPPIGTHSQLPLNKTTAPTIGRVEGIAGNEGNLCTDELVHSALGIIYTDELVDSALETVVGGEETEPRDKKKERELRKLAWKEKKKEEKRRIKEEKHDKLKVPMDKINQAGIEGTLIFGDDAKQWDTFFSSHVTGSIYKPRRYIYNEFRKVFEEVLAKIVIEDKDMHAVQVVEVGCGYGCTMYPLLEEAIGTEKKVSQNDRVNVRYLATDYAITALQILRQNPLFNVYSTHIATDIWDVTHPYVPSSSNSSSSGQSADIVLAIFALSAVKPEYHRQSMEHIYTMLLNHQTTEGIETRVNRKKYLLFRDYGMHDLTMYRHHYRHDEYTFERQDGTICYYFSIEYFKSLAESIVFTVIECDYATVINRNRKTNQSLYRVFLHAVLEVIM